MRSWFHGSDQKENSTEDKSLARQDRFVVESKQLSGRALYCIILDEVKTKQKTAGLMNIKDLNKITCCGPEVHHLRNCQDHWDRCLASFENIPDDETFQPLYAKQIKKNTAFNKPMPFMRRLSPQKIWKASTRKSATWLNNSWQLNSETK